MGVGGRDRVGDVLACFAGVGGRGKGDAGGVGVGHREGGGGNDALVGGCDAPRTRKATGVHVAIPRTASVVFNGESSLGAHAPDVE